MASPESAFVAEVLFDIVHLSATTVSPKCSLLPEPSLLSPMLRCPDTATSHEVALGAKRAAWVARKCALGPDVAPPAADIAHTTDRASWYCSTWKCLPSIRMPCSISWSPTSSPRTARVTEGAEISESPFAARTLMSDRWPSHLAVRGMTTCSFSASISSRTFSVPCVP